MIISKINNISFNGLLRISGPNKNNDITVNTNAVSTISTSPYISKKEGNLLNIGSNEGAVLTLNNGTSVYTFLPVENVVEAYKQAEVNEEAELKTKYNPIMEKPLISLI
ncbi:MAG: hypothetical protein PHC64_06690 [Candidatus Gastranaerophilales bacterium]|nr:hypothetical protein [Candidatus Gastranaerophilales bacterium]